MLEGSVGIGGVLSIIVVVLGYGLPDAMIMAVGAVVMRGLVEL